VRYPGLDLLRAIAIVWVMLFHSHMVGGLGPLGDAFARHGWMGVDLFFVLSGFLIGQQVLAPLSRGERLRFGDFYLRRALRILPAFWVMLALYVLWPGIREKPLMEPWWKFAFFLFNVLYTHGHDAFAQVWSLCVEEHFYLVFPVLAWALSHRLTRRGFITLCTVLVAGGVVLRAGIWIHDALRQVAAGSTHADWFGPDLYYPTWNRLDGLLAGVCLAALRVYRPARWDALQRHANAALLLGLMLLGVSVACFWSRLSPIGNSIGWPLLSWAMALLVFAGASTRSWIGARALPGATWRAAVSYSLYLTHTAAAGVLHRQAGEMVDGHGLATFAAYAVVTLAAGAALHYAVEHPGLRLRDRWLKRRAGHPAAARSRDGAATPRLD
jgi:peptidoglycan/LPS O-acetylase OafA/YrhL